jgi:predicted N-formylglutamate amidohydrolase
MSDLVILITCEHASNAVPADYKTIFSNEAILETHEGWDPGALDIAKEFGSFLELPVHTYDYTRLLIEVNRSLDHPKLFSQWTDALSDVDKTHLIENYYLPYRQKIESEIAKMLEAGNVVVHLSVHTFTPDFFGEKREVEVGLLFDEYRRLETEFCALWHELILKSMPKLDLRFNEPYKGADDGFTTYLRSKFPEGTYIGLELEVSQKFNQIPNKKLIPTLMESFALSKASMIV